MENAVDALKMAGAVLIFVMAISIAILSFGQVRETADIILDYRDRETVYIDGKLYYQATGNERIVGLDTIIPTLYRAYYENYRVLFYNQDGTPFSLYTKIDKDGNEVSINSIGLEENFTSKEDQAVEFLCGILYDKYKKDNTKAKFLEDFNIKSLDTPLNNRLQGKTIKEYIGIYKEGAEGNAESNRQKTRIITYVITN